MPCDTTTTQPVVLTKAMPELVAKAMEGCGWSIIPTAGASIQARTKDRTVVTWEAGKGLTVKGYNNQEHATKLTKAYGKAVVTWAAQRAGWTVSQTSENTLTVTRR